MDEDREGSDVDTDYISDLEIIAAQDCIRNLIAKEGWICGGSLLRRDSKDVDLVIQTHGILKPTDIMRRLPGVVDIFEQYTDDTPEHTGKYCIVKVQYAGCRPFDLLLTVEAKDITEYMQRCFPLSIQRVALCPFSKHITIAANITGPILIAPWIPTDCDTVKKYQKYYPDRVFYKEL